MTVKNKRSLERVDKILKGLEISYERMIADKKAKNEEIVVLRNNKIISVKP